MLQAMGWREGLGPPAQYPAQQTTTGCVAVPRVKGFRLLHHYTVSLSRYLMRGASLPAFDTYPAGIHTHLSCERSHTLFLIALTRVQVITPKTGEAFLKLRLKDQAAALKLLDDDPNLKGRPLCGLSAER